jgi:hypothetical protein
MKKIIIATVILFTVGCSVSYATGRDKIDQRVITTFQKEFAGAGDVSWSLSENIIKANFVYNNVRTEAYFNKEAELVGTARNVLFNQLPLAVMKEINNRYGTASVYEIVEYGYRGETIYTMTVELVSKKLKIKANVAGDVWVEKRIKK